MLYSSEFQSIVLKNIEIIILFFYILGLVPYEDTLLDRESI